MTNHKNLNEMFVSSILKLQLLRKGYSVYEEERIDGRRHDLVFSKKNLRSAPLVVIDLEQYNAGALKSIKKVRPTTLYRGAPVEHHTVFIKGGAEVVTDSALAKIIDTDGDLRVTVYQAT
jgi:hypothetical protein